MILSAFPSRFVQTLRTYFVGRSASRLAPAAQALTEHASFDLEPGAISDAAPSSATVERRAQRIQAPLVWRPAGLPAFARGQRDARSVTRVTAYSDVALRKGAWVEIEVFPRDGTSFTFTASVLRATPLSASSPARFDLVFEIQTIDAESAGNLAAVLI
jgi:hypothetical protein